MLSLIVAVSKNNVIGKQGKIPWSIKGEQHQFKQLTTNNVVVMGRKSYEEIGHPLPNRFNIVISNTKEFTDTNVMTVNSLQQALAYQCDLDIYLAGGYRVYQEAIDIVDRMYITVVDIEISDGDTFFPSFDSSLFDCIEVTSVESNINYTRYTLERKRLQ